MPEKETNLPDWMEGFTPESVEKSLEAGEVYPKLSLTPPDLKAGEVKGPSVRIEILEDAPKKVTSEKFKFGDTGYVISVMGLDDATIYSLWLPNSLRYKFGILHQQHGTLKGLKVSIWKEATELKKWGETIVQSCQEIRE